MVFVRENPDLKWMITRGTPISGNLHVFLFAPEMGYIHYPPQESSKSANLSGNIPQKSKKSANSNREKI